MDSYFQILGELDYLKFAFKQQAQEIATQKPSSPLEAMIDKATGHDKAKIASDKRELIKLLCRIGHRQRRLKLTNEYNATLKMINEIKTT